MMGDRVTGESITYKIFCFYYYNRNNLYRWFSAVTCHPQIDLAAMPITAYCFDGRGDEPLAPSLGSPFADFWDILTYGGKGFADLCGFEIANVIWRHIYKARYIRPKPFFGWRIKIKTGTQFFLTG